jgi:hypothetical protein
MTCYGTLVYAAVKHFSQWYLAMSLDLFFCCTIDGGERVHRHTLAIPVSLKWGVDGLDPDIHCDGRRLQP